MKYSVKKCNTSCDDLEKKFKNLSKKVELNEFKGIET